MRYQALTSAVASTLGGRASAASAAAAGSGGGDAGRASEARVRELEAALHLAMTEMQHLRHAAQREPALAGGHAHASAAGAGGASTGSDAAHQLQHMLEHALRQVRLEREENWRLQQVLRERDARPEQQAEQLTRMSGRVWPANGAASPARSAGEPRTSPAAPAPGAADPGMEAAQELEAARAEAATARAEAEAARAEAKRQGERAQSLQSRATAQKMQARQLTAELERVREDRKRIVGELRAASRAHAAAQKQLQVSMPPSLSPPPLPGISSLLLCLPRLPACLLACAPYPHPGLL